MSSCMCEPVETAQSLGDDTYAVVTRPKWAREQGLHKVCGPPCRWVVRLYPRNLLDTRTWAEVTVRPRPFVKVNRQRERERNIEKEKGTPMDMRFHIGMNKNRYIKDHMGESGYDSSFRNSQLVLLVMSRIIHF